MSTRISRLDTFMDGEIYDIFFGTEEVSMLIWDTAREIVRPSHKFSGFGVRLQVELLSMG